MSNPESNPNSKWKTDIILIIIAVLLPLGAYLLSTKYSSLASFQLSHRIERPIADASRPTPKPNAGRFDG